MHFKLSAFVGLLAVVSPALGTSTLVPQLQQLAESAISIRGLFSDIDFGTMAGASPGEIPNYKSYVSEKDDEVSRFPSAIETADHASVCENYVNFDTTTKDLPNTLIEKHGFFGATPYRTIILQPLRADKSATSAISKNIIGMAPDCASKIEDPFLQVLDSYEKATREYN